MARTPADVPRDLVARLREHLSEAQLVELTVAISWEHYRARFNRVFDIAPGGFSQGAFCALPEHLPEKAAAASSAEGA